MIRMFSVYLFFVVIAFRFLYLFKVRRKYLNISDWEKEKTQLWKRVGKISSYKFTKLGGIYIKLGQFLANAAHLFPDEFLEPLQGLQDAVKPKQYSVIKKRMIKEWNRDPQEIFDKIEKKPIASASTAQVHKAVYKGRDVAIKVLYPGIEDSVKRDMKTIFVVLKWMHKLVLPIPFEEIHKQMDDLFREEMDLRLELKNMEKMRYFFRDDKDVLIPRPEKDLSTQAILVTEWVKGKKWIHAPQVLSKSEKPSPWVEKLIRIFLIMVFRFRFFHADPHPGNIFITDDGKICLLDFGAVGIVNEEEELALVKILQSAMENKPSGILKGLEEMGVLGDDVDRQEILEIIEYSTERIRNIVGNLNQFRNIDWDSEGIREDIAFIKNMKTGLKDLIRALNLPGNYISLQRTADLLIGNIAWIDPYRSVFDYAEKPFREFILRERIIPWIRSWM